MDAKEFGGRIQSIIWGNNLTWETSYEMFKDVLLNTQSDLQQGAFLGALVTKGETVEELYGAWKAIYELDTIKDPNNNYLDVVDNSGTGMDGLSTFNVSTASSIVASSLGVKMARHGARGLSSKCGTVDICEALGINVNLGVLEVISCINNVGIGLFNGMSPKTHPQALFRILSQIHFGTTFNISASLASPIIPTFAVRGVYSHEIIEKVAKLMQMIGIKRAIVLHGFIEGHDRGMDEVSPCGRTIFHEFHEHGYNHFELYPEDLGIKKLKIEELIFTGNINDECKRFLSVISGKGHEPCIYFTALNTAPILYLTGFVNNLREGVNAALDAIYSGKAYNKLQEWIDFSNNVNCN